MLNGDRFFAETAPADWKQLLGFLAAEFHFQPSELWEMDAADIAFWLDRQREQVERQRIAQSK